MMHALVLGWMLAVIPPAPTHYVTDNAHALSATTQDRLEAELHDFDAKTGNQIVVWIGQSTDGEPLERFTADAAQKWKVGHKNKDDGAVLFLFMRDHKVRIEVGYGLESKLTDAESAHIISSIVTPRMRAGDADAAVSGAVDAMVSLVDPAYAVPSAEPTSEDAGSDDTTAALVMLGIFIVVVGGLIFAGVLTIVRKGKRHGDWLDQCMFVNQPGSRSSGGFFFGGGGGGGGGGGFSGGGGGFGGGGASGGW